MLGLAFVFPLVHSTYEGFKENKKEDKKMEKSKKDPESKGVKLKKPELPTLQTTTDSNNSLKMV